MTKEEMKTTAFYNVLCNTMKSVLIDNVDVLTDKLMPILEPFVEDRLGKLKQYEDVLKQAMNPTILIKQPQWTEEDERGSDETIELLEYFNNYAPEFRRPAIRRSIDWLKSLKKRMEEQQ